jgi:murein DD-endopeptidase MepM/ murein hydrolase activator NlpD
MRYGLIVMLSALPAFAQGPALEGDWHGVLAAGGATLRLALHIEKAPDGLYSGNLNSLDQGAVLPFDKVELKADKVRFEIKQINGTFDGTLAGDKMTGTWNQVQPLPLEFTRDAKTAAAAPAPRTKLTAASMKAFGVPVDLSVSVPPTPVKLAGKTTLLYELHLLNGGAGDMDLKKIEVLGDGKVVAQYEGADLNGLLRKLDGSKGTEARSIPPGVTAVAFLVVALDSGAPVPKVLRHRVSVEDFSTEGGAVRVSTVKPRVLGPPLRGDNWIAANGPSNTSGHRRAMLPVNGAFHIAQRFAIDWVQKGADEKTYTGDPLDNKNYHAYGTDVLAVADGTVVELKDGIPENVPGENSRAVPIDLETVGGNHIVLDLGGGRYAFYAHLQPGKLRVKRGDKVKRGQVIGLLGNSGNSTEPHLHFQVSDGVSPLGSEGMPYILESLGAMPAENAKVKFAAQ